MDTGGSGAGAGAGAGAGTGAGASAAAAAGPSLVSPGGAIGGSGAPLAFASMPTAPGAPPPPPSQSVQGGPVREHKDAPVRKATTGLLKTYKLINERYYIAKRERQNKASQERRDADYVVTAGDMLGSYRVLESMGKGSFGQVVSAEDTRLPAGHDRERRKVAVKVIKNREAFRRQAKTEIKLLDMLNKKDAEDQWCIVRFLESFEHNGHVCLVFEHLSFNLYELLRRTHFKGVSLTLIRKFARQILKTLAFLALPEVDIVHCDLKPENILFRVPNRSAIKVIDFGSSCHRDRQLYKYIQSRFYRSPEVVLELPYDQAIDMWSLGCILVEMHTGMPLFSGRDEADQMRRFVALKGLPPHHMLVQSKKAAKFFDISWPPGSAGEFEGPGSEDDPRLNRRGLLDDPNLSERGAAHLAAAAAMASLRVAGTGPSTIAAFAESAGLISSRPIDFEAERERDRDRKLERERDRERERERAEGKADGEGGAGGAGASYVSDGGQEWLSDSESDGIGGAADRDGAGSYSSGNDEGASGRFDDMDRDGAGRGSGHGAGGDMEVATSQGEGDGDEGGEGGGGGLGRGSRRRQRPLLAGGAGAGAGPSGERDRDVGASGGSGAGAMPLPPHSASFSASASASLLSGASSSAMLVGQDQGSGAGAGAGARPSVRGGGGAGVVSGSGSGPGTGSGTGAGTSSGPPGYRRMRRKTDEAMPPPAASASAGSRSGGGGGGAGGGGGGGSSASSAGGSAGARRGRRLLVPHPGPIFRIKPAPPPAPPDAEASGSSGSSGSGSSSSRSEPPTYVSLRDVLGVDTGGPQGRRRHERSGHSVAHYLQFLDLAERMLAYDPRLRIRPMEALNHPFLRQDIEEAAAAAAVAAVASTAAGSQAGPSAGGGGGGSGGGTASASASSGSIAGAGAPVAPSSAPAPLASPLVGAPLGSASAQALHSSPPTAPAFVLGLGVPGTASAGVGSSRLAQSFGSGSVPAAATANVPGSGAAPLRW